MSNFCRVWMAATVAVVQGHTDQGFKWNSGLKSLQLAKRRFSSDGSLSGFRPFTGVIGSDLGRFIGTGSGDDRRKQADDSLQKVMYLSCWGQS